MRLYGFLFLALTILSEAVAQDKIQQRVPEKTRILFVLDGSGSMNAVWSGGVTRISTARAILTRLVDSLKVNPRVELALRVYGHQFSQAANNCRDTKLEVPFSTKNHDRIISTIGNIRPKGATPITYSLLEAANDFPEDAGYRNILILITDGIESCGGDPCKTSLELQRKGVFLKPFVIGLGVEGQRNLDCIGTYLDAENSRDFNKVLNQTIQTTFAKTTVSIELLDEKQQPRETNVNVSFVNRTTGIATYEFVHYRDASGKPDSVQIDPVLSYDLVVHTLPPVVRRNVDVTNGQHNVFNIPVPQGTLTARAEGRGISFSMIVRQKGKNELVNEHRSGEQFRYLAGEYEVETLTLPRRKFSVTIEPNKSHTVSIPPTGLVNINTLTDGIGSIYEITDQGTSWVCNLGTNSSRHALNLLPGNYKVVFRARRAGGSKYTSVKDFQIRSGQTVNIDVFN